MSLDDHDEEELDGWRRDAVTVAVRKEISELMAYAQAALNAGAAGGAPLDELRAHGAARRAYETVLQLFATKGKDHD